MLKRKATKPKTRVRLNVSVSELTAMKVCVEAQYRKCAKSLIVDELLRHALRHISVAGYREAAQEESAAQAELA